MQKSRKILIIAACVVIFVAACIIAIPKIVGRSHDDDFTLKDIDAVTKVFITDKQNASTLLERHGTSWTVNGESPAFDEAVNSMLVTTSRLKVRGPVPESSYNTVISQLANNSNKVEFYANDYKFKFLGIKLFPCEKNILTFYVGSATMDNMGTYMIKENAKRPYIVYIPGYRGFVSPYYTVVSNVWKSHVIFSYRIPQIATIQMVNNEEPDESFFVKNVDSRNFTLSTYPGMQEFPSYDTVKLMDYITSFSDIRYAAALDADKYDDMNVDSILKTVPAHEITITDNNGVKSYLKTFRIPLTQAQIDQVPVDEEIPPYNLDELYAWVSLPSAKKDDAGQIVYSQNFVLCQYFTFQNILRDLSYLQK